MHYLLFYEAADDYLQRRSQFREEHLAKAWAAEAQGELVLAGALADPTDGAVLLFKGDSPAVAEQFAKSDPYVTNGLVKRWYVREWNTVVGEDAAKPVKPAASTPGVGEAPILRMWKATATSGKAPTYIEHAIKKVFPALQGIDGHEGAYLLRRVLGETTELVVLTLWRSMEAVRRFAGQQPEKAVIEPEAQAILKTFDESVTHFEVIHAPHATTD